MNDRKDRRRHRVHPRAVWAGLAGALVGAAVIGLGISMTSWAIAIGGVLLLLGGATAAVRGGVVYDSHNTVGIEEELRLAEEGGTHPGVDPSARIHRPRAERNALEASARARTAIAKGHRHPRPAGAEVGGAMLITAAAVVLVALWVAYPDTPTGRDNGARDMGLTSLAAVMGLALVLGHAQRAAAAVAAAAGVAVLALAAFADHAHGGIAWLEAACGLWVLVAAGLGWSRRRAARPSANHRSEDGRPDVGRHNLRSRSG